MRIPGKWDVFLSTAQTILYFFTVFNSYFYNYLMIPLSEKCWKHELIY